MISVDEAVLARLTFHGERFEILVDPQEALKLRNGKEVKELLVVPEVFSDHKKGLRQSKENLQKAFGTTDLDQIAKKIILQGELHLTAEQRREILERKKKRIIAMISKKAIDPKTGYPHPPRRIENAMREAKIRVDPFKSAEEQVSEVINQLRSILPISLEQATLKLIIPPIYAAKLYGSIEEFGEICERRWQDDGSLAIKLNIPLALRRELEEKLNKLTKGSIKIMEEKIG